LNRRSLAPRASALDQTGPHPVCAVLAEGSLPRSMDAEGVEPSTPAMPSQCSPRLSYAPVHAVAALATDTPAATRTRTLPIRSRVFILLNFRGRAALATSARVRDGHRTHDLRLGKATLWPLSYTHRKLLWARQGSNLRQPECEPGALPLSYAPFSPGAGARQPAGADPRGGLEPPASRPATWRSVPLS
jgi:hypothetical protein